MNRIFTRRWFRGVGKTRRGVTMVELIVGMIVVGTAAIGTTIAVFNAYGQLQRQRHRLIANQYLRSEVEFWQGRIHTAMPSSHQMSNATAGHLVTIDERDPTTEADDIIGKVVRKPIRTHIMVNTSTTIQYYWEIPVTIKYTESSWVLGQPDVDIEYSLIGYWLESEPTNHAGDQ